MLDDRSHTLPGRGLLDGKVAVIYGAAGGVGSTVSRTFAREGAKVFLAGRTLSSVQELAEEITRSGGFARASEVDAMTTSSVEKHLEEIVAKETRIDISFNLISVGVEMGASLIELPEERFMKAAFSRVRSYFITMTAAARIMKRQKSGVILGLTAPNARIPRAEMGGFSVGGAAIESLCRQLALEVGPDGVRVVCIRTGGTPDNPVLQEVFALLAKQGGTTSEAIEAADAQITAAKRLPRLVEVANAAVILASDYASAVTATAANASCGELVD